MFRFFAKHPTFYPARLASYAILAWRVSKSESAGNSDPFYRCRRSFTIGDFIHNLSDIQAELHRANKVRDVYPVLRWYFLDSELDEFGLGRLVLGNTSTGNAGWQKLADIPPQQTSGVVAVTNSTAANGVQFYRLVTPMQP